MAKKLSEMTLEELWALFPIRLTEHRACWADWYAEEERLLRRALPPDAVVRLAHVGSTAVKTIWAKPIVDILLEIPAAYRMDSLEPALISCGYRLMNRSGSRASYNKGYTENGFAEKVFHLHLRYRGDHDELYFRDYLTAHPDAAKAYEALKLSLWEKYEHDRDGYTNAKAAMVSKYTERAKREYGNRYEGEGKSENGRD